MKKGNLTEAQKLFKGKKINNILQLLFFEQKHFFKKKGYYQVIFLAIFFFKKIKVIEQLVCIYVKHHKYMEASNYLCLCLELREKLKDPGLLFNEFFFISLEHYSLADTLSAMAQVFKLQNRYNYLLYSIN